MHDRGRVYPCVNGAQYRIWLAQGSPIYSSNPGRAKFTRVLFAYEKVGLARRVTNQIG